MRNREKDKHSSESKSSDDDLGTFFYAKVWFFHVKALPTPWSHAQVRISPSMATKGFKTIITDRRFRAFVIGGSNSRQNYEFLLERKVFKERAPMLLKRAYFAHALKSDKFLYILGGRGDSNLTKFEQFVQSQSTVERYDMELNRWVELEATLNEGRYHATACTLQNRFVYVFGGYKTEGFYKDVTYKVSRKHEKLSNVRSDFIEVYDTTLDQPYVGGKRPSFGLIQLKRDTVNNMGNLICFPLLDQGKESGEVLITGGLFVGIIDVKSHVFNTHSHKLNLRKNLALPYPDISKFYYHTPENKVYVVGRYRIQEFDQATQAWSLCGKGYVQFCDANWNF